MGCSNNLDYCKILIIDYYIADRVLSTCESVSGYIGPIIVLTILHWIAW